MSYPIVEYRAGDRGTKYNNVNFARQQAESIANDSGQAVPVYCIADGNKHVITEIKPKVFA
jgi:hypothetical protein